jgi:hypothetical protein
MPVFRPSLALPLCALAIAIFAVGCGGGGDEGGSGEASGPTKVAYVKRADAICTKTNEIEANGITKWEVEHGAKPGYTIKAPSRLQELKLIMPMIRQEIRELAALKPPPGEEDEVDAFVSAYQEAAKEKIADLLDGESDKYEKAFLLMRDYGFKTCGVS